MVATIQKNSLGKKQKRSLIAALSIGFVYFIVLVVWSHSLDKKQRQERQLASFSSLERLEKEQSQIQSIRSRHRHHRSSRSDHEDEMASVFTINNAATENDIHDETEIVMIRNKEEVKTLQKQVLDLHQKLEEVQAQLRHYKSARPATTVPPGKMGLLEVGVEAGPSQSSLTHFSNDIQAKKDLMIRPHELPGYTGWARPMFSLANSFAIVQVAGQSHLNEHQHQFPQTTVGQPFRVTIQCQDPVGQQGGSLFYVRAFSQALLPGLVHDHGNGTYTISVLPHDPGFYTLEVVLTLSQKPNYKQLPNRQREDPSYEGHMVPGFPLQFSVVDNSNTPRPHDGTTKTTGAEPNPKSIPKTALEIQKQLPRCTAKQLTEQSPTSPLETGRWLVTQKTTKAFPDANKPGPGVNIRNKEGISMEHYKDSKNSLGFQMDYFYTNCSVMSYQEMTSLQTWHNALSSPSSQHQIRQNSNDTKDSQQQQRPPSPVHILYIGDSNTRNQYNYLRDHVANKLFGPPDKYLGKPDGLATGSYLNGTFKLTYIDMMGHWHGAFNATRHHLNTLIHHPHNQHDRYFVMFNAGLHEISHRCMRTGTKGEPEPEGRCHDVYTKDVRDLTALIQSFQPSLTMWQTTVAGWPKWGVFGVSWPQDRGQRFPMEPNFCDYMNGLAWEIMHEQNIPVMDTYWMTLSRPDHREIIPRDDQRTSYKLVHLGDEVYSFLVRKFIHIVFESMKESEPHFS